MTPRIDSFLTQDQKMEDFQNRIFCDSFTDSFTDSFDDSNFGGTDVFVVLLKNAFQNSNKF